MHPCMIYFISIYHKSQANVGTNTIHGSYAVTRQDLCGIRFQNCHADPVPFRVALMEKPLPEYSNGRRTGWEQSCSGSENAADRMKLGEVKSILAKLATSMAKVQRALELELNHGHAFVRAKAPNCSWLLSDQDIL